MKLSQYSAWPQNGRRGDRGSIPDRKGIFTLASVSRPALRPTQFLSSGYHGPFPGGKERPGLDTDTLSSVGVKNEYELHLLFTFYLGQHSNVIDIGSLIRKREIHLFETRDFVSVTHHKTLFVLCFSTHYEPS
jgi:hypothetical protein